MAKISTKINLEIDRTTRDRELEKKIPGFKPLIRIFSMVGFNELEFPENAIIDTGAHISVMPFDIWEKLNVQIMAEHKMQDLLPDKSTPVNVGYVKAKIIDDTGNTTNQLRFLSYLAFTNKIPLILGMRDVLEKFNLHILFSRNQAYLEMID